MFRIAPDDMETAAEPQELTENYAPTDEPTADEPEIDVNQVESDPNKLDQSIVVYMTSEYGPFECQNCKYWVDPNACSIVSGEIDPKGVCNVYTPPDQAADMEAGASEEEAPVPEEGSEVEEELAEPEMGGQRLIRRYEWDKIMDREKLIDRLTCAEGYRDMPYTDTTGNTTIGIGHNLTAKGLTRKQINMILEDDIDEALDFVYDNFYLWFPCLDDVRQRVITEMVFNIGSKILQFKIFLGAVATGQYEKAASAMLDSLWAKQVGNRAKKLSAMMLTGTE